MSDVMLTPDEDEAPPTSGEANGRRAFLKAAGVVVASLSFERLLEACTIPGSQLPASSSAPLATAVLPPTATSAILASTTPTVLPSVTPQPSGTPAPTAMSTPGAASSSVRTRLAHLLRRAGFGAGVQELDGYEKLGVAGTVDYLLDYENADDSALDARLASLNLDLTKVGDIQRTWLLRMIYTKRPLQEKMTLFWHGLLTSGVSKVGRADLMWQQNQLFRMQALGRFPIILKAISRDPAMLIWLDSQSNRKSAPNENFARELMELFSMGVGNYTETDVRESARAFTGWSLDRKGFSFNAAQHDTGMKTFLSQTGPYTGDDIVDIIVQQPASAAYICRRLFTFFMYDSPSASDLARVQMAYVQSGYSIKAAMRALLTSDAFYSDHAYRARVKSPAEMVASTARTLGTTTDGAGLAVLVSRMGQTLFDPPNVAGWQGGPDWITSVTLLERVNFANRIASDRRAFKPLGIAGGAQTLQAVADYYVEHLLDGNMPAGERAVLNTYIQGTTRVADRDAAARAIVYLILGSPDYQIA